MRRRFKCDPKWITVRNAPDARSPTARRKSTPASERSITPAMRRYGTRCGHGEKAERDFNAHRIDEDGF
jgi:hypothetical protein